MQRRMLEPLRGEMPTWALVPFATAPAYVGYWYLFGPALRFSSPTFGAAKEVGALLWASHPMAPWGIALWVIAAWITVGIFAHRGAAHLPAGMSPPWRILLLALGLVAGGAFTVWWGTVGTLQAARNPAAAPTGAGWLSVVAFAYFLAAVRVASGRENP